MNNKYITHIAELPQSESFIQGVSTLIFIRIN